MSSFAIKLVKIWIVIKVSFLERNRVEKSN